MGELSRKIGEDGEALAQSFFKRIGWSPIQSGLDITCSHPKEHASKKSKGDRTGHGVDLLFSYICPLMPRLRRNILVSMKNSDFERTENKTSLIRDDLRELDWAIECFSVSERRAQLQAEGGAEAIQDSGLLVRINRDPSIDRSFLGGNAEAVTRQANENLLYFVENERFDFVDSCMNYLDLNLRDHFNAFNIQRNALNLGGDVRLTESTLLPVQSLVAGPIVVRSKKDAIKSLLIFANEPFSQSTLKKLIGLGLQCSNGWASEVRLVFPDYDRTKKGLADEVRAQIQDRSFAQAVSCDSFQISSRLK